jgi:hypothetical protein
VGFVVGKLALGQVFSGYFCFPFEYHSTNCSALIIIYQPVVVQEAE